jgi:hypothetical protein
MVIHLRKRKISILENDLGGGLAALRERDLIWPGILRDEELN